MKFQYWKRTLEDIQSQAVNTEQETISQDIDFFFCNNVINEVIKLLLITDPLKQ